MVVGQTKEEVVLSRLFVSFQIRIGCRLVVVVDKRFDISRNRSFQLTVMLSRDVVVVLVGITVHHTAAKETQ